VPWFKVPIAGDGLDRAMTALNGADIPTMGPAFTGRGDVGSAEGARVGRGMLAVLDADSAEDAEAHVEDNLPDGEYDIGPTEPWPD
jgi:hypothetical protein